MKNVRLLVAFLVAMGGLVLIASQKRVQESTEISAPNVIKVAASEVRIDNIDKADNYSESLKEFLKVIFIQKFLQRNFVKIGVSNVHSSICIKTPFCFNNHLHSAFISQAPS